MFVVGFGLGVGLLCCRVVAIVVCWVGFGFVVGCVGLFGLWL